jgi:pilus assembly protein CpaE
MPAKILVIDGEPGQRVVRPTLQQNGYDVVGATSGAEGFRKWQAESPDLVLVAAAGKKIDGYAVAAQIRAADQVRHTSIVMLGPGGAVEEKIRGLRAGADDFLVKPFLPAELIARIRSLLLRAGKSDGRLGQQRIGRVLAFYGAKGGVGTTTLAVNTAIALHRHLRRRVVLVDGKLQFGDHRVFFDLGRDRTSVINAVAATSIDLDVLKQVMVQTESGVDLLLAPPSPVTAELVTQEHLPQILSLLATAYDYAVVDVDTRLDEMTLRILDAADVIFVIMAADLPSLKNVRLLLETVAHVGYDESKLHLVLNRSTAEAGINLKSAEAALERRIDFQIVNDYRLAIVAINSGAPFASTRPDAPLSRSVAQFAEAIDASPAPAPAPGTEAQASMSDPTFR